MKTISIIGAGSHTRSSINLLNQQFEEANFQIFDDSFDINNEEFIHGIKLSGKLEDIKNNDLVFLSIGDNVKRAYYFNKLNSRLIQLNLFHRNSYRENILEIGISNQIYSNVYINSYVKIGNNNIINTSAILEHEVSMGNHNHISIGAKLCGRSKIGNNCLIGAGAIIIDKITICDNVIIGGGSVVIKNITLPGTYVGNPIRKVK